MANDVYIKFGLDSQDETSDLPEYEGDSTDSAHLWWCELRECGFDMNCPKEADPKADPPEKAVASTFKSVTLKKRLDWASTQLFDLCIQAAMKMTDRPILENGVPLTGLIDEVTVDVCRPAGGEKASCVKVIYKGVRIIKYGISLSGPEPAENITFEFDKVRFRYYQTNPYTGELVDISGIETDEMDNHHEDDQNSGQSNTGGGTADGNGDGSGGGGSGDGALTPAVLAAIAAAASSAAAGSAPDPTVTVNFPGLWQGTGFGVLPD
jgi:type VI protein secretion system component Hcp